MKSCVQNMLRKFASNTETMCHGDLHSGSIMCTNDQTRVIDPEFAFYGPMGFDLGMLLANFLMAYFSQEGHRRINRLCMYMFVYIYIYIDIYIDTTFETKVACNFSNNLPRSLKISFRHSQTIVLFGLWMKG